MTNEYPVQNAISSVDSVASYALCSPGYAPPSEEEIFAMQVLIFSSSNNLLKTCKRSLDSFGVVNVSVSNDLSVLHSACKENILDLLIFDAADDQNALLSDLSKKNESAFSYLLLCDDVSQVNKELMNDERFAGVIPRDTDSIAFTSLIRTTLRERLLTRKLLKVTRQAHTDILIDPLTQIANRRAFNFELSRKMIEWQRQRSPLALMMIDIDFFKRFNDQYGHQAGDRVLLDTAQLIQSTLREMDLVCRFGGEEFAVVQPLKHSNESTRSAERIRSVIESSIVKFEGLDLRVTASIGVAEAMKGDDVDLLVKRADVALYAAKQNGRNQVMVHDGAKCVSVTKTGEELLENCTTNVGTGWAIQDDDAFNLSAANLFIVDDSQAVIDSVCVSLRQGGFQKLSYEIDSTVAYEKAKLTKPELILLDIDMPGVDGLTLLSQFRADDHFKEKPIIILTAHTDAKTKNTALELGASDVLHKPVSPNELIARVNNTLLAHAHSRFLKGYSQKLEHEVTLRTTELLASRREAILCLARAAEINTLGASRHILRIGKYAAMIAKELGFSESQVIEMEHAAQLHDIGKVEVPDNILTKPDNLTDEEFEVVKEHCFGGSRIIRDDDCTDEELAAAQESLIDSCSSSMMRMAAIVAESHHEKWDGSGYPHGLKGLNIPIEGRIVAVCDVFDALSNPNSKRDAFQLDDCFEMILERKGSHFDPEIVDVFFRCKDEIVQIYNDFSN